jgi:hypothetical protein
MKKEEEMQRKKKQRRKEKKNIPSTIYVNNKEGELIM